jgi:hypothetical protein
VSDVKGLLELALLHVRRIAPRCLHTPIGDTWSAAQLCRILTVPTTRRLLSLGGMTVGWLLGGTNSATPR